MKTFSITFSGIEDYYKVADLEWKKHTVDEEFCSDVLFNERNEVHEAAEERIQDATVVPERGPQGQQRREQ